MVLDVTLPRRARVPRALVHRFTVRTVSASGESRTWIFRAVSTPVSRRRPVGALAAAARRSLRFAVAGDVTNLDEFLTGAAPAALQPSPRNGLRRSELPLQSSVVRFPG